MIKKGDTAEIYIDTLAYGGEGIGRYEGMTIFVPDVVPGDSVKIEIIDTKKTYARGICKKYWSAQRL